MPTTRHVDLVQLLDHGGQDVAQQVGAPEPGRAEVTSSIGVWEHAFRIGGGRTEHKARPRRSTSAAAGAAPARRTGRQSGPLARRLPVTGDGLHRVPDHEVQLLRRCEGHVGVQASAEPRKDRSVPGPGLNERPWVRQNATSVPAPVARPAPQAQPRATPLRAPITLPALAEALLRRDRSTVDKSVRLVWAIADEMTAANSSVTHREVIAECVRRGIALNTAKTQYSAWRLVHGVR